MRKVGEKLIDFFQTPMGEEIVEGTMGGLLAGVPLFFQDNDPGAAAIQTLAAISGGIGLGMAGRRIGAAIGKTVQPGALADQDGLMATLARGAGSETLGEGLGGVVNKQFANMQDGMKNVALMRIRKDASELSADEFQSRYNMTPAEFTEFDRVNDIVANATRTATKTEVDEANKELQQGLEALAEQGVDPGLLGDVAGKLGNGVNSLSLQAPPPVTGEHVGRMLGRFIGDEVGIMGGVGAGALISQAMGFQTPKDREIARLQEELKALQGK